MKLVRMKVDVGSEEKLEKIYKQKALLIVSEAYAHELYPETFTFSVRMNPRIAFIDFGSEKDLLEFLHAKNAGGIVDVSFYKVDYNEGIGSFKFTNVELDKMILKHVDKMRKL